MKRILQSIILLSFVLLGAKYTFALPSGDQVIISEVQYDPSGTEPDGEWFELYNPTAHSINIRNFSFTDGEDTYTFPIDFDIDPNSYKVFVHTATEFSNEFPGVTADYEYGEGAFAVNIALGNSGDELTLKDAGGNDIDFVSWEGSTNGWDITAGNGESIERNTSTDTDGVADWDEHQVPTPGTGSLSMTNHAPVMDPMNTANNSVPENQTAVTTILASDPDTGDTVTYGISGGADAGQFTIDANTGAVTFVSAPDYENPQDANADNTYEVQVSASDGFLQDTMNLTVQVTDVLENSAPSFTTSNTFSIQENTITVTTVNATDPDAGDTVSYSIFGAPHSDGTLFTVDANTGALSFINAPDYENPQDDGIDPAHQQDNEYLVVVRATDSHGAYSDQLIHVTVTDINESSHHHGSTRVSKAKLAKIFGKAQETQEEVKKEETKDNLSCGFTYSRLIRYGTKGEDVRALQTLLNSLGFNTGIADGMVGPKTTKGIKAFQKAMGIMQDGIVGPQTTAQLMTQCSA